MGMLWKDVYWLYTADILPCYNGIELYTPLYVTFICAYPVKVTIHVYESPLESPWGSRKYPGYNRQVCTWMCMLALDPCLICFVRLRKDGRQRNQPNVSLPVCQCVWVWGNTHFCGISIMITDGLFLIWPPGHLQLHCSPSSDGCNCIRWNEWFC